MKDSRAPDKGASLLPIFEDWQIIFYKITSMIELEKEIPVPPRNFQMYLFFS